MREDWERVHLTDEIYLKEVEWLEQEYYYRQYQKQKPAKIKLKMTKDKIRKRTSDYVCVDCGVTFLSKRQRRKENSHVTTFHKGECGLCNKEKAVTHIRAYNYLHKPKLAGK